VGGEVIAVCRTEESVANLLQRAESAGHSQLLLGIALDLTRGDALEELASRLEAANVWPEGLVNNARAIANLELDSADEISRKSFTDELTLGVVVPYELTTTLAAHPESRLRSVINIASIYGLVAANPHLYDRPTKASPVHYGVTKAALLHLTRELASRLAPRGIRVNAVSFGGVDGRADEAFARRYAGMNPMARMLNDEDLAGPVTFLLSPAASGVTGHNLVVDGGWTVW
jgi:hypothetical protein